MKDRRFISVFFTAFFAILLFIGLANYLIDPYGMHFHNRYEGFNKHKPSFLNHTRIIKLFNADKIQPDALFLGNSRLLYLVPEDAFGKYQPRNYYMNPGATGNVQQQSQVNQDAEEEVDDYEKLMKLAEMYDEGLITKEEFEKEKAKIFGNK